MGHVYQQVTLAGKKKKRIKMMVDTGATYSVISRETAKELGIRPAPRRYTAELADGRKVRFSVGVAMVRVDGREAPATILIGPAAEALLGVETLEALGLAVDPSSGRLKPTRSYTVRLGGPRLVRE